LFPDGSRDFIRCGPGHDEAWVNGEERDFVVNCEIVHWVSSNPDIDADLDGITDEFDNCGTVFNPNQADLEEDGIGDVCDSDDNNDHSIDPIDNCPLEFNPDQKDEDHDGVGDACDFSL
jgi:hypothetical protein